MRIISGSLGGRTFATPGGKRTHPMSDKIRGALFNALGELGGLSVLDAFGGSGALSFEAISRGAKSAVVLELDKTAYGIIVENIKSLELGGKIKAIRANAAGWSNRNFETKFDVVLMDPPYDNTAQLPLDKLAERHLKNGAILVLSFPARLDEPVFSGLDLISKKEYGDAQLVFYRKTS